VEAARAYRSGDQTERVRRPIGPLHRAAERTTVDLVLEETLADGLSTHATCFKYISFGSTSSPGVFSTRIAWPSGMTMFAPKHLRSRSSRSRSVKIATNLPASIQQLRSSSTSMSRVREAHAFGSTVPNIRECMHQALEDSLEF
jgi:hypothetical protein